VGQPSLRDILAHHPDPAVHGLADPDVGDTGYSLDGPALPEGLAEVASEIMAAVHSGDAKNLAACLMDAFDLLESRPHEEGPQ
jgi:hypothetical protein